jgi:MFS family permease
MVVESLSIAALLAGIAGGVVGAAVGGLPALSLAGVVVLVGESTNALLRAIGEQTMANPGALTGIGITETMGLGPALGPHVAFAGGVAAAAYAGRNGGPETDFPYHRAKDIATPLGGRVDVLLAGAIFGVIGVLLARLAAGLSLPLDPVAFAVVVSGIAHRVAFGYSLLGRIEGNLLDMGPYEAGDRRSGAGAEATGYSERRFVVEPWQPFHYDWAGVAVLGAAVGIVAGFLGIASGSAYLAFGLAVASLLFLALGSRRFPVTHHMALPASIAALGLFNTGLQPWIAILGAALFGLLGGLLGELAQRTLYAHGDTHLDPSFASILLTSLLLVGLAVAGVLDPAAVPYPIP